MPAATQFYTINEAARILGADAEMLEAIVSTDENLSYGNIINVHTGQDEAITAINDQGIEELREMIRDARSSPQEWQNFLVNFASNPQIIARINDKGLR